MRAAIRALAWAQGILRSPGTCAPLATSSSLLGLLWDAQAWSPAGARVAWPASLYVSNASSSSSSSSSSSGWTGASSTSGSSTSGGGSRKKQGQQSVRAVKQQTSCTGVYQLVAAAGSSLDSRSFVFVLSAALDHMKRVERGGRPWDNLEAASSLLQLAVEHGLHAVNAWTLVAFIRCAAAFKGSLQPAGLEAWQAALRQRSNLQALTVQGVGNALLSLGTLADSDPRLDSCIDKKLAAELLLLAASFADDTHQRAAQHAMNALYGAALLGLRPTQAQMQALCSPVRRSPASLGAFETTQLLLACQKLMHVEPGFHPSPAPSPSQNPYHIYYPGTELIASLLGQLCQPVCSLAVRDACQIVGACGALGFMPDPWAWRSLMAVVEAAVYVPGVEARALLMGCAKLGINPGPKVIAACWDAVEREGPTDSRMVANAAWALAVLEACDVEMWSRLAAMMTSHSKPPDVQLRMWHQAYLLVEQQPPGEVVTCLSGRADIALQLSLALSRQYRTYTAGHFEATVKLAVKRLATGRRVACEHPVCSPCGKGQVAVDVALPELRIAIEADGVRHFLRNGSPGQQTGDTLARNRLLRGWGWHVIVVPFTAFDALCVGDTRPSQEQLVQGLVVHLQEHTDLVARLKGVAGPGSASPTA